MPRESTEVKYKENIEVGMQRLYYVAWVCWLGVGAANVLVGPNEFKLHEWVGFFVVGPAVGMFMARYLYRGFVPKDVSQK